MAPGAAADRVTGRPPLRLLLLPGLDGTGAMFAPFVEALSPAIAPEVIGYPVDAPLDYDALEALVAPRLPAEGPYALLGESFSGPLSLRLAARGAVAPVGVVLVATFVTNPVRWVPAAAGGVVGPWLFRRRMPAFVARRYLTGGASRGAAAADSDASASWTERIADTTATVNPAVMAARVREVLRVDACEALRACPAPLLYLGGARDRLVLARAAEEILRLRPDVTRVTIDAPHMVLQIAPEASARAIEAFVGRAAAGHHEAWQRARSVESCGP